MDFLKVKCFCKVCWQELAYMAVKKGEIDHGEYCQGKPKVFYYPGGGVFPYCLKCNEKHPREELDARRASWGDRDELLVYSCESCETVGAES